MNINVSQLILAASRELSVLRMLLYLSLPAARCNMPSQQARTFPSQRGLKQCCREWEARVVQLLRQITPA